MDVAGREMLIGDVADEMISMICRRQKPGQRVYPLGRASRRGSRTSDTNDGDRLLRLRPDVAVSACRAWSAYASELPSSLLTSATSLTDPKMGVGSAGGPI